ncbi:MAG: heme exporter protein CcmD [Silicimonas sp.]|jgi:heme exporter protein D|nr:heme exporter protein CcmD [Silicimonas sp.]
MPDLGNYAAEVTLAYAGSILLLAGLIWLSWAQARSSRRRLEEAEGREDG